MINVWKVKCGLRIRLSGVVKTEWCYRENIRISEWVAIKYRYMEKVSFKRFKSSRRLTLRRF